MSAQVLHWSAAWADVVGGDGPAISDLLGRIAPALTDEQAAQLRAAERDRFPTRRELELACDRAWGVVDRNGLRTALACVAQSADRVIDTLAPFDRDSPTNDRWHQWMPARRALDGACRALVVRKHDPDLAGRLAEVWVTVMGPLPPYIELDTALPGGAVPMVTEAEAARAARHQVAGIEFSIDVLREEATLARWRLAQVAHAHPSWDVVRGLLTVALNGTSGVSAKAREHIERQFGVVHGPAAPGVPAPASARPADTRDGSEGEGLFDVA